MFILSLHSNGLWSGITLSDHREVFSPSLLSGFYNYKKEDIPKVKKYEIVSYYEYLDILNDSGGNDLYREVLKRINKGVNGIYVYQKEGQYLFKENC